MWGELGKLVTLGGISAPLQAGFGLNPGGYRDIFGAVSSPLPLLGLKTPNLFIFT